MKLNDFVNKMLDKGFKKSYTQSKKTMFLNGDEILMYINDISLFTNNIQIALSHENVAIFLIDGGLINIDVKDIKRLTII